MNQDNDKLPAFRVFGFLLLTVSKNQVHDRTDLIHVNIITSLLLQVDEADSQTLYTIEE